MSPTEDVALLRAELETARRQVETLHEALRTRGVIDQAKGMLMALYRIEASAAFDLLREASQAENIKVHRLAEAVVDLVVTERIVDDPELERLVRRRLLAPAAVRRTTGGPPSC